jgi:CHAD domain-containing protein
MAYRLERAESVIQGLKRIVRREMEAAAAPLLNRKNRTGKKKPERDEAIHEARKSVKKTRAVLRLVRAELGDMQARENAQLQDVSHRLSTFRDALVTVETFDDLKDKYKSETRQKLRSVRAGLMKRRNQTAQIEDAAVILQGAGAALRNTAKRVDGWPLKTEEYAAIGPGFEETFRAGRKALARVRKDPRAENFHELRKKIKDHWYHVRLLEGPLASMSAYEKKLKDLEDWLGDDHNLVVLRETIMSDPEAYGKPKDIDLVLQLIEKRQKKLRKRSLSLARRVYDRKPRAFNRRVERLWDVWRERKFVPVSSTAA